MKLHHSFLVLNFFIMGDCAAQFASKSKCEVINYFVNSKHVTKSIPLIIESGDSTIAFLDPDHLLDDCGMKSWRGLPLTIVNAGPLIDSLKHWDPHFVIKDRINYYLIMGGYYRNHGILFHRPCDNLECHAHFEKKQGKYYIENIECGVF